MNVVLVTEDNDSSRAASSGLSLEETQRSVWFLEWALQSQLVILSSVAFPVLLTAQHLGLTVRFFHSLYVLFPGLKNWVCFCSYLEIPVSA